MEVLYTIFILPIELVMEYILNLLFSYTNSYGISIIVLSIFINILMIPLNLLSERMSYREKFIQHVMKGEVDQIAKAFSGQERYMMLRTLYRQYQYHPIYALRSSLGLLVQIPFFIAAYQFLSHFPALEHESFLFISDLANPDGVISFGAYHINILPIFMTLISVINTYYYTKNASRNEKVQGYGLAVLFLVLLYISPAGLVLYWTSNNVVYTLKNIFGTSKEIVLDKKYNSLTIMEHYPSKSRWQKISSLLEKISLMIPLGWLLSHIFMWSNNAHMFTNKALFVSFIFIILMALIFWGIGELWLKIINNLAVRKKKLITAFNVIAFSGAFSLIVGIFLLEPVLVTVSVKLPLIVFFAITCLILAFGKVQLINALCAILLIFSTVNFVAYIISLNVNVDENAKSESSMVTLKKKPNMYLFWLESYHDFATQRKVYGIDTRPVQNFLKENAFVTYDKVYTDGSSTLNAFSEIYGMGQFNYKDVGVLDATSGTRQLIGGNDNNILFKTLKNNDYHTAKILTVKPEYQIIFGEKSKYLDITDYDHLHSNPLLTLLPCFNFSNAIRQYFLNLKIFFVTESNSIITGSLFDRVNTFMIRGLQSQKPFFISFKGGANHTPGSYNYLGLEEWLASGYYAEKVKNGNNELKRIIENIILHDSNSLIILATDHGAWRFRGVHNGATNIQELREKLQKANISYEDFIDDTFGGIMAIRFPQGEQIDIAQGYYMSQRNLFTHIFAFLSDDPSLLQKRVMSRGRFEELILTRDGKILME